MFDALILDVDGTIWNTTPIVANAWNEAIALSGLPAKTVNADMLKKEFGKTMDVIADDLWPELDASQKEKLMSLCCTQEQQALLQNTQDITFAGVVDTIKSLSRQIGVFIVSNCQEGYIELSMEKTGLTSCITDYECFGRTGKGKADNLRLLIDRNKIKCPVYVGDTQGDADACAQAGVPFVWAEYGFGTTESCYAKINAFSELEKILKEH